MFNRDSTHGGVDNVEEDMANAKRNSLLQNKTHANHFFGAPTGADTFHDTVNSGFGPKMVQPPMIVGKAKIPSDL